MPDPARLLPRLPPSPAKTSRQKLTSSCAVSALRSSPPLSSRRRAILAVSGRRRKSTCGAAAAQMWIYCRSCGDTERSDAFDPCGACAKAEWHGRTHPVELHQIPSWTGAAFSIGAGQSSIPQPWMLHRSSDPAIRSEYTRVLHWWQHVRDPTRDYLIKL